MRSIQESPATGWVSGESRLCVLGGKNAFVSYFPRGPRDPRGELFSLGERGEPAGSSPPLQDMLLLFLRVASWPFVDKQCFFFFCGFFFSLCL